MSKLPDILKNTNSKNLIKEIFKTDVPEVLIKEISSQTLFLAIKQNGLPDSSELIELCTDEQRQLLLDMDLWQGDNWQEEQFWQWLALPEITEDISILRKILRSVDLKLVSDLIIRYVEIHVTNEPTDEPPGDNFYSPDKGHTWLSVKLSEPDRNFLMTRFIACIFEYSAEIFYQLINVGKIATPTQLEEEAFKEKEKRLLAEGFPDHELSLIHI